jgi:hypothetical protein
LPERLQGSTLALRCRGLLGASARSEIVRVLLLDESERPFDVRELTLEARFTKRGVAEALDNLLVAAMVRSTAVGNSRRYALLRGEELQALFAPIPRIRSSQRALCRIIWSVVQATEELSTASDRIRRVESARLLHGLESDIRRVDPHFALPDPDALVLEVLQSWCAKQCETVLANG